MTVAGYIQALFDRAARARPGLAVTYTPGARRLQVEQVRPARICCARCFVGLAFPGECVPSEAQIVLDLCEACARIVREAGP